MNAFVNLRLWGERVIGFLYLQTDKASMLDEAIEYLKQLQLQVQVSLMWSPLCHLRISLSQHVALVLGTLSYSVM